MSRRGRHGEWKFGEICQSPDAKCDVVVNKAADDQHGWDHILDITPPKAQHLPADLQTPLVQCFAQIKTTSAIRPSTRLKLSNAIKAAKSPLPSFVFLLHYPDGKTDPVVYGRHIWEEEISEWLEKARKTEATGRRDIHKQSLTMNFSKADKINQRPGDWILDQIDAQGRAHYSKQKSEIFNQVGYSHFTQEGTIKFGSKTTSREIVLNELGVIADLPANELTLFDKRFGIRSSSPILKVNEGRISFSTNGTLITLHLSSVNGRSCDIPAKIRIASLVEADHPEFRVRINSGHIDLLLNPSCNKNRFSLNYDVFEKHTLLEQLAFLCLVNWSQLGPVQFSAMSDEGCLFEGRILEAFKAAPWMLQYENSTSHLVGLLGREKSSQVKLSLAQISDINRSLHLAASIFTSNTFCFEANFEGEIESFKLLGAYVCGEIEDWSYGAIYKATKTRHSKNGLHQKLYFNSPHIIRSVAFRQPLEKTRAYIEAQFKCWRQSQGVPTAVLMGGDLKNLSQAIDNENEIEISVD